MKRMTDGHKTVEITMEYWDETQQRWIDVADDFFADGQLHEIDCDIDATVVNDVDYCVWMAKEWEDKCSDLDNAVGVDEDAIEAEERRIWVYELN